jgi:hypothetical protein
MMLSGSICLIFSLIFDYRHSTHNMMVLFWQKDCFPFALLIRGVYSTAAFIRNIYKHFFLNITRYILYQLGIFSKP